jgi:hypothetical protein
LIQKTFVAPNKRNAREPTDHDVQIISVYAPPPLPSRRHGTLGFSPVDVSEIEIVIEDSRDASDAILETQVIPFVEDVAPPSRLRRSVVMVGILALSAVAGFAAYRFAPKLVGLLRLPASVATVSDASKPLPTPVARPTQTVATPAAPSMQQMGVAVVQPIVQPRDTVVSDTVAGEAAGAVQAPLAGSAELLAPTSADIPNTATVKASDGKVISRAKLKKSRRLRARQKRARARARSAANVVASPQK